MLYQVLMRPLLFRFDPERAHELTLWLLQQLARVPTLQKLLRTMRPLVDARLRSHIWGVDFANPVGLAAGFDKNATAVAALPVFGFGFVEIGTVTPRPQKGTPRPRLFRLPRDQALINRLGFNNDGAVAVARRLRGVDRTIPIGVNIGKNAETPLDRAVDDYRAGLELLHDVADYVVVNVSSPNTPGLRELQTYAKLRDLLAALQACNQTLARARSSRPRPLFVKIAPDLERHDLDGIIEVAESVPLDGIVATNTTLRRTALSTQSGESGGLSGHPLAWQSTEIIRYLYSGLQGRIPIVGVGGIFSALDAYEKICAGASLVQVYTGLIYVGPSLPYRINAGLIRLLDRDGFDHLSEAVGCVL
jgi:dihydroorotate dehydrogenase